MSSAYDESSGGITSDLCSSDPLRPIPLISTRFLCPRTGAHGWVSHGRRGGDLDRRRLVNLARRQCLECLARLGAPVVELLKSRRRILATFEELDDRPTRVTSGKVGNVVHPPVNQQLALLVGGSLARLT